MNTALIKVSLDVIAGRIFGDAVTIKLAMVDSDDIAAGTVTFLIEGDQLPAEPEPAHGMRYNRVSAVCTLGYDEANLVPKETLSVRFVKVDAPAPPPPQTDVPFKRV
jgi:hypothetical protein